MSNNIESKKEKLICKVLSIIDDLAMIEVNETCDEADLMQSLFAAHEELKDYCNRIDVLCRYGKKLRGAERC